MPWESLISLPPDFQAMARESEKEFSIVPIVGFLHWH